MVNGVIPGENEFGHRHDLVSIGLEVLNNVGKRFRRVQRGIVEQYDAATGHIGGDPGIDLACGQILPVQTVPVGSGWKATVYPCLTETRMAGGKIPCACSWICDR